MNLPRYPEVLVRTFSLPRGQGVRFVANGSLHRAGAPDSSGVSGEQREFEEVTLWGSREMS